MTKPYFVFSIEKALYISYKGPLLFCFYETANEQTNSNYRYIVPEELPRKYRFRFNPTMDRHNSQDNFNMEAYSVFENMLKKVKNSNLNYKLELSPFSAKISLKKSFIRDKSGIPLLPRSF